MLITRFDPLKEIRELERRFASMFGDIRGTEASNVSGFIPAVNSREGEYAYHIEIDLPGVNKEDISIDLKGNILTISGERKMKNEVKEQDYYKVESFFGKFQRSFTLPENVDTENIRASVENGVLEVVLPKMPPKDSKKISVQ